MDEADTLTFSVAKLVQAALYQVPVQIAVEGWSETEQQHEEIGGANTMKKTENAQGREHEEGTPGD